MGLAASQARFLAITSRKAYCEFQSMQIAQDKLSVTRDLADISDEYQNALNKTKLVWDYDGTGENPYNLSYGVLMTPSVLNNYTPYLITNRTGAVVLNGQLAAAAAAISESGAPTSANANGFEKFVDALEKNGVITESAAEIIRDQEYSADAGYGGEPLNKNGALVNNLIGLSYAAEQSGNNEIELPEGTFSTSTTAGSCYKVKLNGNFIDPTKEGSELTISDLLTNDVVFMYTFADGQHGKAGSEDAENLFKTPLDNIMNQIHELFTSILGIDAVTESALNTAKLMVEETILNTAEITSEARRSTDGALNNAVKDASKYNLIAYGNKKKKKHNSTIAINLSNLVAAYLTYFELSYNGYESNFAVGPTVDTSYFVTDDPYYNYLIKDKETVDNVTIMQADFYMQLYNNICANGWTQNNSVDDNNYLENALKNGTYFITSLNGDGYFYQGRYNEEDCIVEITDQDAIAQAEAEFTSKKAKLTYKEEQLDMEMKNLDTEISSLTTEYDSVKNLISKNVEKIFTMFQ